MTRVGRLAMHAVTGVAGGLALVMLAPALGGDGYAFLGLVILLVLFVVAILVILLADASWRLARPTRRHSDRDAPS